MGGSSVDTVGPGSAVTDPTTGLPYGQSINVSGTPTIDPATQAQLDTIYNTPFNPATADTPSVMNYVSYAGTG